ncbi:MAG: hypothetical protein NTV63_00565 [Candidatus Woesearchaeota archaeon]|nr:hypothetical protein [Candidatus Woesearchaeota archaeon]
MENTTPKLEELVETWIGEIDSEEAKAQNVSAQVTGENISYCINSIIRFYDQNKNPEKATEIAEKAIEAYENLGWDDKATELTEELIKEYEFLREHNRHNRTDQTAKEAETTPHIGLYVGQKKRLEAQKIAYGLERNGYDYVVTINSAEPNDLDISVNGIMFSWGEADRMIERLLIPKVKKDTG